MTFLCIECEKKLNESNFYRKVKNKCKNCSKNKMKGELCGNVFTKKWLTSHIEREHQSKPKIDNVNKKTMLPEKQIKTTSLMFQNTKITPMLLSAQETLVKLITC